jgi:transposase
LQPFRAGLTAPAPVPVAPSVRQVTGWLTRHPDSLDEDERLHRKAVLTRSPALTVTAEHVSQFAQILTGLHGDQLAGWISDVEATDAPTLRSFAHGLRNDLDAVTNGLTLGYSSGAVEGTVNRIKTIKRQMYGRAKFDLLRKRILNPA